MSARKADTAPGASRLCFPGPHGIIVIAMGLRYVIQDHDAPAGAHFDLMFEVAGALATWRIDRLPTGLAEGESVPAVALTDHRLAYLTREGEVSGGRGRVAVADRGEYRTLSRTADAWRFELLGGEASGVFELQRVDGARWELRRARREP